jgi:type IV secretory pathway ATPase VirB11/archaellum biosynthesis ATPase
MLMLSKALFSYVPKVVDENNIEEISMNEDKSVFIKYKDGTIEMVDNPLNIEDLKRYVS